MPLNTINNSNPNTPSNGSITYAIFDDSRNFMESKVNSVWGNAGYTTQKVDGTNIFKTSKDVLFGTIKSIISLGGLLMGGSSGFKSTRYFHNYIQNVTPINAQFIPDQIQTYASIANVSGEPVAESVQKALKAGRGYNLKKYYQYHKSRYKNRQWNWQAYKTTDVKTSTVVFEESNFLSDLIANNPSKRYKIVDINKDFVETGQLYLDMLDKYHGINTFGNPMDSSINFHGLAKSRGVTVWSTNKTPTAVKTITLDNYTTKEELLKVNKLTKVGDSQVFDVLKLFENPYDKDDDNTGSKPEDEFEIDNTEILVTVKVTLIQETELNEFDKVVNGKVILKKERTYSLEETQTIYKYEKEEHYYITEAGISNYPNFEDFWHISKAKYKRSNRITSDDSTMFKFYGHMPIKDWIQGNNNPIQTIPMLTKEDGIVKAIHKLDTLTNEAIGMEDEKITDSSIRGNRTNNKLKRVNYKDDDKETSSLSKLGNKKEKEVKNTNRNLQRFITRELNNSRKLELNRDILSDKKDWSPRRLKQHIDYMCNLIGVDYMRHCAGLVSQNTWEGEYNKTPNTMQTNIMLGAIFSNQTKESHDYWYEWAKRQYKLAGKEDSFEDWKQAVNSVNSLNELPQQVVKFQSAEGTMWGGFSFCFIRKLVIRGRTRKIKRKHRLKDILRGKPQTISTLAQLKNVIEPLQELADDTYYFNKISGKEYPVGGEIFAGQGVTESSDPTIQQVLQNYSYTFFAKSSGRNEITCYAVCGLQFHTKMEDRKIWGTAWYDLGMEFERLKLKYVDKKAKADIDINFSTEKGSRKHRYINKIYNFGVLPLEYDVVKRMNAVSLENFAQRAVLQYTFLHVEIKGKRSGMKYAKPVIMIAGIIISTLLSMVGQVWSWAVFAQALIMATITSVIINFAINKVLIPLLSMLGLKGIVAMIVLIVIVIVAMVLGGGADSVANVPYANEAIKQATEETVKQTTKEAVKETVKKTTEETIKSLAKELKKEVIKQLIGDSVVEMGTKLISYAAQSYEALGSKEVSKIEAQAKQEQNNFNLAMSELEETQEEMINTGIQYDYRTVLEATKFNIVKIKDFDLVNNRLLNLDNLTYSYESLISFLDFKLNLNPETFDPVNSTDFRFTITSNT